MRTYSTMDWDTGTLVFCEVKLTIIVISSITRMHSSKMRTARSLTASRSIRREGVRAQGCVHAWGACMPGGVHGWGVCMPRGYAPPVDRQKPVKT